MVGFTQWGDEVDDEYANEDEYAENAYDDYDELWRFTKPRDRRGFTMGTPSYLMSLRSTFAWHAFHVKVYPSLSL